MVVNDNAGNLTPSGVLETIANEFAPTGGNTQIKRGFNGT